MFKYQLGILGAGNMASAILKGIREGKILPEESILVSDLDTERLESFSRRGFSVTTDNKYLVKNCKYVLFAVKPQTFPSVVSEVLSDFAAEGVLSVMAGIPLKRFIDIFGEGVKVCRVMPNTPCMIGEGVSAVVYEGFSKKEKDFINRIFDKLGLVIELDEEKFDAVTALSGSGPAYIYTIMDAMIQAGVSHGLTDEEAKLLTVATLRGASSMVERFEDSLTKLTEAVTSKGGTTEVALKVLETSGIKAIIANAMKAAADRSKELGMRNK